jgi:hypothetical protein
MAENSGLPLVDLVSRLLGGLGRFLRYELDLAAIEASEDVRQALAATRLLLLGCVLVIAATGAALTAAIAGLTAFLVLLGLEQNVASSLAALIVAAVAGGLAWTLFVNGANGLRAVGTRVERLLALVRPLERDRTEPRIVPDVDQSLR